MKKPLIFIIIIALVSAGIWYWKNNTHEDRISDHRSVRLSGSIEAVDAQLSFRTPGQIEERLVHEAQRVAKGQVLARLDDVMQAINVQRNEACVAQARGHLEELKNGSRPQEIALAKADLEFAQIAENVARTMLDKATTDFERNQSLIESKTISPTQFDAVKNAYDLAVLKVDEARANVIRAREALSLREAGPREELIQQAAANLDLAEAGLNQSREELGYTVLKAPFTGTILTTAVEPGEWVQPGKAVMTLGKLDTVWVRAYLNETDLGKVKLGQKVQIHIDSYPARIFEGELTFISEVSEFTPKQVQTHEERVKLVYRVKITLPNPDGLLKPGMPAEAEIW